MTDVVSSSLLKAPVDQSPTVIPSKDGSVDKLEISRALAVIPVNGGALVAAGGLLVTTGLLLSEDSFGDKMQVRLSNLAKSADLNKKAQAKNGGAIFLYILGLILILIGVLKSFTNIASAIIGIFAVVLFAFGVFLFRQEIVMTTQPMEKRKPIRNGATATLVIGIVLLMIANLVQNWQTRWETVVLLIGPFFLILMGYAMVRRSSASPVHIIRYTIAAMSIGWILAGASMDSSATILSRETIVEE